METLMMESLVTEEESKKFLKELKPRKILCSTVKYKLKEKFLKNKNIQK